MTLIDSRFSDGGADANVESSFFPFFFPAVVSDKAARLSS